MEYKDEIIKIIKEKESYSKYSIGVSDDKIVQIEEILKVKLPESYKWFLKNYGQILIMGVEIYGVLENKILSCVKLLKIIENLDYQINLL